MPAVWRPDGRLILPEIDCVRRRNRLRFAGDPEPYGWERFGHVEAIIGENKMYRESGFFEHVWPSQYLVIGEDGFGILYFLNLSRGDEVVFLADQEASSDSDEIATYAETPNLVEWIRQMKEERAREETKEVRDLEYMQKT